MTEKELLEGCLKGSKKAQKHLYEKYSSGMLGVCYRYAGNLEEAEDILQDGFIAVFQQIKSLKDHKAMPAWIKRIIVNTALLALRKKKRLITEVELEQVKYENTSDDLTEDSCTGEELMRNMQNLAPGYRAVLNLYAIEGFSHREISSMLNISEATSRTQYFKAKERLKELVKKKFNGE